MHAEFSFVPLCIPIHPGFSLAENSPAILVAAEEDYFVLLFYTSVINEVELQ
jgi:hypothetical protein